MIQELNKTFLYAARTSWGSQFTRIKCSSQFAPFCKSQNQKCLFFLKQTLICFIFMQPMYFSCSLLTGGAEEDTTSSASSLGSCVFYGLSSLLICSRTTELLAPVALLQLTGLKPSQHPSLPPDDCVLKHLVSFSPLYPDERQPGVTYETWHERLWAVGPGQNHTTLETKAKTCWFMCIPLEETALALNPVKEHTLTEDINKLHYLTSSSSVLGRHQSNSGQRLLGGLKLTRSGISPHLLSR